MRPDLLAAGCDGMVPSVFRYLHYLVASRLCGEHNLRNRTGELQMAKSAVTGLTEHLESIRQGAYTEGYAAAMRAVAEFSTSRTAKPKATTPKNACRKIAAACAAPVASAKAA